MLPVHPTFWSGLHLLLRLIGSKKVRPFLVHPTFWSGLHLLQAANGGSKKVRRTSESATHLTITRFGENGEMG